jgi:hypothetical protein
MGIEWEGLMVNVWQWILITATFFFVEPEKTDYGKAQTPV